MRFCTFFLTRTESRPSWKSIQPVRRPQGAGLVLAMLSLVALSTPRAEPGFLAPLSFDTGLGPVSVALADLDRDGILDLVTADGRGNTVSVLLGKGDGTFQTAITSAAGSGPDGIVSGDVIAALPGVLA